jgi:DNA-binding response OmpR family regulator
MPNVERQQLGEILVRRQVLSRDALHRALLEQGRSLLPLGSTVLKLGLADEASVARALAEQLQLPGADLGASVISSEALGLLPETVARSHRLLPVALREGTLLLALASPNERSMLDEISFATGREIMPFVAVRAPLEAAIGAAYEAKARGEAQLVGPRATVDVPHLAEVRPEAKATSVPIDVQLPDEAFALLDRSDLPVREKPPNPHVLVVDDEDAILDIIDRALSLRGIQVIRATRGRQAIELLTAFDPELILLDAMLPEIHGFELCSKIKRSHRYGHTPVIIISALYTGWNFAQDVKRLYGADDYIAKPFRVVELVRRVEELLEKAKGRPRPPDLEAAVRVSARECKRAADLYGAGQIDEALEAADRAVQADPFDARAHFMLGTLLYAKGQIYQAISEYERAVEISPSLFSALKNLAVLYERQGFKAKAVELWMRALEQSPSEAVRNTIKAHLIGLL